MNRKEANDWYGIEIHAHECPNCKSKNVEDVDPLKIEKGKRAFVCNDCGLVWSYKEED